TATRQHLAPEAWLERVERDGHATRQFDPVAPRARLDEMLMMGLRLHEGVALERITLETGRPLEAWIAAGKLQRLIAGGFLTRDDTALTATEEGRARLDSVLAELL
ncbi:MAG TPA: hypothetical protein VN229_03735, partial [Terriglobales bacterium]|nr:hypothetical protein [Terriglobales bacterium]